MPADRRADGFLRVCRERGIEGEVLLSDRLSYGSMHYESYIEKGLLEHPETDGIFASTGTPAPLRHGKTGAGGY